MKKLIKNGTLVTPTDTFKGDLLIVDGVISEIGQNLSEDDTEVIDASGKFVLPGGVDVHTHMDLQAGAYRAVDDFYDGTVAASCGGTTSIVDHIAFAPEGKNLHYMLDCYHEFSKDKAVIDYGFHGICSEVNDAILDEMNELVEEGVPSIKVYSTYDGRLDDAQVLQVLKQMKESGGITAFHCENHHVLEFLRKKFVEEGKTAPIYHAKSRPNLVEAETVSRYLDLAKMAGDAPIYIVHLSCKESLDAVKQAREAGQKNIFVETCPQYLCLTEEEYLREDALKFVMSPPLRTAEDNEALWDGLASGDIQVIATDHCPFNYETEKQAGEEDFTKCPNGAPGVEERMALIFSEGVMKGKISINQFVEVTSTNPAKIYGCYPKKGALFPGSDADIILLDPNKTTAITHDRMHSNVDYTAYEGYELQGKIDTVLSRGDVLFSDDQFYGEAGRGRYLPRKIQTDSFVEITEN